MAETKNDMFARCPWGFTAIELMLGLAITGLVMAALAGVMAAVGQGWQATQMTRFGTVGENASVNRVAQVLREARTIGAKKTSSNGSVSLALRQIVPEGGGSPKLSEMAVLEFDAPTKQVRLVSVNTTRYDLLAGLGDLLSLDVIGLVKGLLSSIFGGRPEAQSRVLAEKVQSMDIQVIPASANQLPRVDFTIEFARSSSQDDASSLQAYHGSATLRSPVE